MVVLNFDRIKTYRHEKWRLDPIRQLQNIDQAVGFIHTIELLAFWPLKEIPAPSLWYATAGERPVPSEHDDPGHVTWGWKDALLGDPQIFYARILCKRTFFVTKTLLPSLYALSNNYGNYAEDHIILYEEGRLTSAAKSIYDALLREGPLDSIALHRITHLTGKQGDLEFNRALDELQMDFKVMPVGISTSGRWHYSMIYDIVARRNPDTVEQAGKISHLQARTTLVQKYLQLVGAARLNHISKLFKWPKGIIESLIEQEVASGHWIFGVNDSDTNWKDWVALTEFVMQ